jgi:hypothetical protein
MDGVALAIVPFARPEDAERIALQEESGHRVPGAGA